MNMIFCKILVTLLYHGGPIECHPEILNRGTITVKDKKVIVSNWGTECALGGPYNAGHGVWFCYRGFDMVYPKDQK